jgi:twinkle protein
MARIDWKAYGIEIGTNRASGQVKVLCPQCTPTRTNKSDRSLSCNLATGEFMCHHCDWHGVAVVLTDAEKKEWLQNQPWYNPSPIRHEKKTYKKPEPKNAKAVSDRALKWFEGRGISAATVAAMRITEGLEFMPQKGREFNTVQFNYYKNETLVNTKFRTGDKCFKLVQGAELLPYNIDAIKDTKECIITEGECFDDKAQVLTQSGWKLIKDVDCNDLAAQRENGCISFARPLAKVCKYFGGNLVEFSNSRHNYYSLTTPLHNLVVKRFGKVRKMHAEDINSQIGIIRSGVSDGPGIPLTDDMLRLLVAISADFTIRETGDLYAGFKKQRKVKRIVDLLMSLGIKHTVNPNIKGGYTHVFIHRGGVVAFKEFPDEWLSLASEHQVKVLLDELVFWDGNSVNGRTMKEYSTKLYHNAVWVQTLCHLGGMCSTIQHRKNQYGEWYKVSMLKKNTSSTSGKYKNPVPYDGLVYCLTMPAGTLLVRQNDLITVSGNCDALSFYEVGRHDVVSVPSGANSNLSYLDDYIADYFDNKETIYIASDSDTKGVQLRDELLRRFGEERCKVVEYGEGCKDANEHLQKYGRNSLLECLKNAKGFNIEGVFTVSDFEQSLDALWVNGMQKGVTIGHKYFDDLISFETKRLCVVTGIPGSGKSEFIDEITERLNIRYGWRFAYFSPENSPLSYHASKLVEKFTGKHFSKQTLPFNEYQQAKAKLESDFFFILPDEFKIDTILEKAKLLVRKNGIKSLVIDPYNRLENEQGMLSETQYISALLDKLQNFAVRNDVLVILMVHPTKMKTTDGVIAIPTLYDCSGSANFYNKCDFGIVVHRDKEKKVVEVRVDKVKFKWLGETGKAFFKYDINNGRYVSIHDSEDTAYTYDSTNHLQKANYERLKANGEAATLDFPDLPEDSAMPANTAFDDIKPTDNVPF